ncbi:MAG: DUF2064 domain-containing protein [Nitrospinota bacterium]
MNVLIVFAKAPVEGMVKTRLEKDTPLNQSEVCQLYRSFLDDTLKTASESSADKIIVNYSPAEKESLMRDIAEKIILAERLIFKPQTAGTFHERVGEGFQMAFDVGAKASIMIGSDSPTMRAKVINEAFDTLNGRGGAVLGPSGEGGIYLIGLKGGYLPDFQKIFESAGEISNFAMELEKDGVPFSLLEEALDVDVASDLVSLVALINAMKRAHGKGDADFPNCTRQTLEWLGLRISRKDGTRDKALVRGE